MVLSKKTLDLFFPDWNNIPKGEWSEHSLELTSDGNRRRYAGLYREPDKNEEYADTLTLQITDGDDVVFCDTVIVQDTAESCPFCTALKDHKDIDSFYRKRNPASGSMYTYTSAFLANSFFHGKHVSSATIGDYPLNFCPVCGKKL